MELFSSLAHFHVLHLPSMYAWIGVAMQVSFGQVLVIYGLRSVEDEDNVNHHWCTPRCENLVAPILILVLVLVSVRYVTFSDSDGTMRKCIRNDLFARVSSYFTQNSHITNQTGDSVYNLYGDIARKFRRTSVDAFSAGNQKVPT